jgi:hypothetical protein
MTGKLYEVYSYTGEEFYWCDEFHTMIDTGTCLDCELYYCKHNPYKKLKDD